MTTPPRRARTVTPPFRTLGPGAHVSSYQIVDELAVGGMGTVYEAVHTILPRRVAIKVMHGELINQPGAVERLFQEASIIEQLAHPGVLRLYEVGLLGDRRAWMAMELVRGATLTERISHGPLTVGETVALLGELGDVLAFAHATNIVHRDLKPDNVLLRDDGGRTTLIDWGIARAPSEGPRLTLENATPGTPTYMAPEQARGAHVDGRCDVYALGVLAYEALTGAPPFAAATAMDVVVQHLTIEPKPIEDRRPDAPPELADLIHAMLTKEVERRPTAADVLTRIRALSAADEPAYEELILADEIALARRSRAITPRSPCDEVSGELVIPGLSA